VEAPLNASYVNLSIRICTIKRRGSGMKAASSRVGHDGGETVWTGSQTRGSMSTSPGKVDPRHTSVTPNSRE
jgi:hypothetical protein